jgi:hypothetical protein
MCIRKRTQYPNCGHFEFSHQFCTHWIEVGSQEGAVDQEVQVGDCAQFEELNLVTFIKTCKICSNLKEHPGDSVGVVHHISRRLLDHCVSVIDAPDGKVLAIARYQPLIAPSKPQGKSEHIFECGPVTITIKTPSPVSLRSRDLVDSPTVYTRSRYLVNILRPVEVSTSPDSSPSVKSELPETSVLPSIECAES